MTIVRNFEIMLGQILNYLCRIVVLCSVIPLLTILLVIKFDIVLFNWHDNRLILKPQFHLSLSFFAKCVLNINDTNTAAKKY
jgi:hypothetical protein